jgi:hypothetical protein
MGSGRGEIVSIWVNGKKFIIGPMLQKVKTPVPLG